MTQATSPAGAVVVDANIPIAIVANEPGAPKASAAITRHLSNAYELYAPGVITAEVLFVLCRKLKEGLLTPAEHAQAVEDFELFMRIMKSPPGGEGSLVRRADSVRGAYACRRSADGIYIALAEELDATIATVLLTFDEDLAKQTTRYAPAVTVDFLTV